MTYFFCTKNVYSSHWSIYFPYNIRVFPEIILGIKIRYDVMMGSLLLILNSFHTLLLY